MPICIVVNTITGNQRSSYGFTVGIKLGRVTIRYFGTFDTPGNNKYYLIRLFKKSSFIEQSDILCNAEAR